MKDVSVIIPNWNGKELLEKNLPSLVKALQNYNGKTEIIVVDDGSTDDSIFFLESRYQQVKIISFKNNKGFAPACNAGVRQSKYEIVYLLNSDIKVEENFLTPLLSYFEDPGVFAVSSSEVGVSSECLPTTNFRFGMFLHCYIEVPVNSGSLEILFASGGRSAFDKEKFLSLGGFDEIFSPFYWEDIDLCWRAWKGGWKILSEPKSQIFHEMQKSIGKKHKMRAINHFYWKNHFLFIWKNFSTGLLMFHLFFLPVGIFLGSFIRRGGFYGFIFALSQLREVFKKRKEIKKEARFLYSDTDILRRFREICPNAGCKK